MESETGDIDGRENPANGDDALAVGPRTRKGVLHRDRVFRIRDVEPVWELHIHASEYPPLRKDLKYGALW